MRSVVAVNFLRHSFLREHCAVNFGSTLTYWAVGAVTRSTCAACDVTWRISVLWSVCLASGFDYSEWKKELRRGDFLASSIDILWPFTAHKNSFTLRNANRAPSVWFFSKNRWRLNGFFFSSSIRHRFVFGAQNFALCVTFKASHVCLCAVNNKKNGKRTFCNSTDWHLTFFFSISADLYRN